jgi:hypothetical protein
LGKQLDDGRIKVDSSLAAGDYAVTTLDGRMTTDGDQMDLHPSVVDGSDSTFLQEVLVHEAQHKTQANSSEAADEVEAYSLEKAYKDSIGLDSTNFHYRECTTNLAYYTTILDSATVRRARRASAALQKADHVYKTTPGNSTTGEAGVLKSRLLGDPDWSFEIPLMGGFFNPADLLQDYSSPSILPANIFLACGQNLAGEGMVIALEVLDGFLMAEIPLFSMPNANFHCMSFNPDQPHLLQVLDTQNHLILTLEDQDGDFLVDSFFDIYFAYDPTMNYLRMDWENHSLLGAGILLSERDKLFSHVPRLNEEMLYIIDADGDLHADVELPVSWFEFVDLVPIIQHPMPLPGDISVNIFATWQHEIEIWSTNEFGDPLEFLGSQLMNEVEQPAELSRPMLAGEWIRPFDVNTATWQGQPVLVAETIPEIEAPYDLQIEYTYDGLDRRIRLDWQHNCVSDCYYMVYMSEANAGWIPVMETPEQFFEMQLIPEMSGEGAVSFKVTAIYID